MTWEIASDTLAWNVVLMWLGVEATSEYSFGPYRLLMSHDKVKAVLVGTSEVLDFLSAYWGVEFRRASKDEVLRLADDEDVDFYYAPVYVVSLTALCKEVGLRFWPKFFVPARKYPLLARVKMFWCLISPVEKRAEAPMP